MKQKNKWLDLLIVLLFATGVIGACVSIDVLFFKIHPVFGYFVISIELIIIACILHDFKDL